MGFKSVFATNTLVPLFAYEKIRGRASRAELLHVTDFFFGKVIPTGGARARSPKNFRTIRGLAEEDDNVL